MTEQNIEAAGQHETGAQVRAVIGEQADLHMNGIEESKRLANQVR